MFKKYKNLLSRLIRTKKGVLLLVFLFVGLFAIVRPTQAFIGTGLFDYAMSAMGGLADLGGWAFAIFFSLFLGVGISTALVGVSASLLEWSMSLPVNVMDNALVTSGWEFVLGLVNLFFILILIYIALSYILKMENLGMKKALPNLIIIALLINFSLLLVGIFVDVATFFQNTILDAMGGNVDLAHKTIETLTGGAGRLTSYLAMTLGASMVGLAIPFADIATMIANIGLSLAFLPNIVSGLFITLFNIIVGLIFLFYTVLFIARIIVIWLLAIFAPLAFMSYILPGTRKFFNQWIHTLLSWSFLGIIALFLVMLGLKLAGGVMGEGGLLNVGDWTDLPQYVAFYVFFTVYFVISLLVSKKLAPMGSEIVWRFGGMTANRVGKWATPRAKRWKDVAKLQRQKRTLGAAQRLERIEKTGSQGWQDKLRKGVGLDRMQKWTIKQRGGVDLAEATAMATRRQLIHGQRVKLSAKTRDMDNAGKKALYQGEITKHWQTPKALRSKEKTAALMELLAETDGLKQEHRNSGMFLEACEAGGEVNNAKKNPTRKAVLGKMLQWGTSAERKDGIDKMAPANLDKLSYDAKKSDEIIKEVVGTLRVNLINRLGAQSKEVLEKTQKEINRTLGEAWKNYPSSLQNLNNKALQELKQKLVVLRSFHAPAANLGFPKYGTPKAIKNKIEAIDTKLSSIQRTISKGRTTSESRTKTTSSSPPETAPSSTPSMPRTPSPPRTSPSTEERIKNLEARYSKMGKIKKTIKKVFKKE